MLNDADIHSVSVQRSATVNVIRKPLLYSLSYEGLTCAFAQHAGRVLVCRARAGCLASDDLCCICAACGWPSCRPPPPHATPTVRLAVPDRESDTTEQRDSVLDTCAVSGPLVRVSRVRMVVHFR